MARPKTSTKVRTTIFVEGSSIADLDYIARTEAVKQNADVSRTDLINQAIEEFKQRWIKKNGEIPVK